MIKERDQSLDIFRAFGIMFMIMGHVGFGDAFNHFIHAFHMPMFFFVTGYFYKERGENVAKDYFVKKCRTLLVPYIFFALLNFLLNIPFSGVQWQQLKNVFWVSTTNKAIPAGALWFLTALFFADLLYFLLYQVLKSEVWLSVVVLLLSFAGMYFQQITGVIAPWALTIGMAGMLHIHIGRLMKKYQDNKIIFSLFQLKLIPWFILSVITVVLIFFNGYINMRLETYANPVLYILNATLAAIVGINLAKWINKVVKVSWIKGFVCNIGKNSILFVTMNQWGILVMKKVLPNSENLKITLINHLVITIVVCVFCYFVSLLFAKTKLKVILGK